MKKLVAILCLFCPAWLLSPSIATAQDTAVDASARPDGTMSRVSRSAEQELAKSIGELNQLRSDIANEKLPLAQELTSLEEKLSELRRDHEKATRSVDTGTLELSAIKGRIKVHQDELAYMGNLLDEYARTFETRVNVSELQYCGKAIETAKQATENTALSMSDKFARQTELVTVSMKRLFDAIGGLRFPGVGVDLQGSVATGRFAIIGPVALFRGDTAGAKGETGVATGLVVPQSGSTNPLIRPLDGALQSGIASLVDRGDGLLPLDPSRGGALKALVQNSIDIVRIFKKGGPIMWPLLVAAVLAIATVLERLIFLMFERLKRDPQRLNEFFTALTAGRLDDAIAISKDSKYYVLRALHYALSHKEQSLANALVYAQAKELKRFSRGIPVLDTVITLAPLLGLLGTVTGMMGSFQLIGGDLGAPGAITGGIAEALIATAFGLGIAITSLIPFNFLNARSEEARHELESAATQLELLVQPSLAAVAAVAHAAPMVSSESRAQVDEIFAHEDALRRERELKRKRETLEREMAELRMELAEHEQLAIKVLPARERASQPESKRHQPAKE
jgi:biopolymer transport protein ExbB